MDRSLRRVLRNLEIDPLQTILLDCFLDDADQYFVAIVTPDDKSAEFDLDVAGVPELLGTLTINDLDLETDESDRQLSEFISAARTSPWPCPGCDADTLPSRWLVDALPRCSLCGWEPQLPSDGPEEDDPPIVRLSFDYE